MNEEGMRKVSAATVIQRLSETGGQRQILLGYHEEKNWYEFPGGKNKNQETIETTARREVEEELGWSTANVPFYLHSLYEENPEWLCAVYYVFFKSHAESFDAPGRIEGEPFTEWRWFSMKEVGQLVIRPDCQKILRYMGLWWPDPNLG